VRDGEPCYQSLVVSRDGGLGGVVSSARAVLTSARVAARAQTFVKYEDIAKHANMRSPVACALLGQWHASPLSPASHFAPTRESHALQREGAGWRSAPHVLAGRARAIQPQSCELPKEPPLNPHPNAEWEGRYKLDPTHLKAFIESCMEAYDELVVRTSADQKSLNGGGTCTLEACPPETPIPVRATECKR
jgi:hypothetical protein